MQQLYSWDSSGNATHDLLLQINPPRQLRVRCLLILLGRHGAELDFAI